MITSDVCRVCEVSIQCYLRTERPKNGTHGSDLGHDLFLGGVSFSPDFGSTGVQNDWVPMGGGAGKIQIGYHFAPGNVRNLPHPIHLLNLTSDIKWYCLGHQGQSLTIDSFELLKVIGKGSFGKVMQVRKRDTQRIYALKTIRKAHIASRNEITHTLAERFVLSRVNNPFIVPLKFSFQSEQKLYLVLA